MNLLILIIDENTKKQIREIVDYAHTHPLSIADMEATIAGKLLPVGENHRHVLKLLNNYKVVYSEEIQPLGFMRHLSVSVQEKGKYPHPSSCSLILKEFGFKTDFLSKQKSGNMNVWIEEEAEAVNFLEIIK